MRSTRLLICALIMPILWALSAGSLSAGTRTGLSYAQITRYLAGNFALSQSTPVDSQPRYMGATADHLAMLELIGDRNDLTQATLMIGIPNDSRSVLVRNTAMFVRFVKNAAPGWAGSTDWATMALKQAVATDSPVSTIRGARRITISFIKTLAIVSVTVKHR